MRKKTKIWTLFVAFLLILTSCSSQETNEQSDVLEDEPAIAEQPVYVIEQGGAITVGIRNPSTLNPVKNDQPSVDQFLRLIFEPLIALDETLKPAPSLAQRWEFSPDGLTLTIRLRQDAKWHDGTPVTANDVKFTIDEISKAPEGALYKPLLKADASYQVLDAHTIQVQYTQSAGNALYGFTFPVIPEHYYKGQADARDMLPLGNGLYSFYEHDSMKKVVLKAMTSCVKGTPNIETIYGVITPDRETDLYSYEQNLQDIIATPVLDWRRYSSTKQSNISYQPTGLYDYVGFNFRKPRYQDIAFRQMIAMVLPKQEIIENIYLSAAVMAETPVNPASWLYTAETARIEYDPEAAKALWDALENKEGFSVLVNSENTIRVQIAERLVEELGNIGITASLHQLNYAEYTQRLNNGDFDLVVGGWQFSVLFDPAFAFHSASPVENGNILGYKSQTMDDLLGQIALSAEDGAMQTAYDSFQQYYAQALPTVSIAYRRYPLLTGEDYIEGQLSPLINDAYNGIETLKKKKKVWPTPSPTGSVGDEEQLTGPQAPE